MDKTTTESEHAETSSASVFEAKGSEALAEVSNAHYLNSEAAKNLKRKCDLHVIPPLFIMFLLSFLDRTNIGNAKVQGLERSLNLSGTQYNIALLIFFIPYILFEVPSNLIIRKIAPSTWLSSIMVFWGIATIGLGLIRNFAGIVALRFVLGIFEAGLLPGCVYLISMYYRRHELQWRMSLFFSAGIVAGAIGGLFAYALAKMDGVGGYEGWRWIFIIEGIMTTIIGAISKFWIVDWPETSKFLTVEERALLTRKLADDGGVARMDHLNKRSVKLILLDWKIWCGTFMYMGVVVTSYSTSFFIPTIINQMGFTSTASQIRSIPIFVAATAFSLLTGYCTDKLRHRYAFLMIGVTLGSTGYVILLNMNGVTTGVRYMACFFITIGGFITQPITMTWLSNQMGGHYKRSMAAAIQIGVGNCGGIAASNIFLRRELPRYITGFGTALAMLLFCGLLSTMMLLGLIWENKKRDAGERNYRYNLPLADLENLGDDHPEFRFTY